MLFLWLLQLAWPAPEAGLGFALGLTFATLSFREGEPATRRKKV